MINRIFKSIFVCTCGIFLCACSSQTNVQEEQSTTTKEESIDMEYKELKGRYVDVVSGEAEMEININKDKKSVEIVINWENGDDEVSRWIMNASFQGTKLSYNDCQEYLISFTQDGSEVPATISQSSGFFKVNKSNRTLAWTGSSSNRCKTCIFEKVSDMTAKEEEEKLQKEEEERLKQEAEEENPEGEESEDEEFEDEGFEDEDFVDEGFEEVVEEEGQEEYYE